MRKMLVVILLVFSLTGCSWFSLVEPTLEIVDGVEELSKPQHQPQADVEVNPIPIREEQ